MTARKFLLETCIVNSNVLKLFGTLKVYERQPTFKQWYLKRLQSSMSSKVLNVMRFSCCMSSTPPGTRLFFLLALDLHTLECHYYVYNPFKTVHTSVHCEVLNGLTSPRYSECKNLILIS